MQGLDRYAYVNNNPLRYNDPTGHESICVGTGVQKTCTITGRDMVYFSERLENISDANREGNPTWARILGKTINSAIPSYLQFLQIPVADNPDSIKLDIVIDALNTPPHNHGEINELIITYNTETNNLIYEDISVEFSEENASAGYDSVSQGLDILFGVNNDGTADEVMPTELHFPVDNNYLLKPIPYSPGGGRNSSHKME